MRTYMKMLICLLGILGLFLQPAEAIYNRSVESVNNIAGNTTLVDAILKKDANKSDSQLVLEDLVRRNENSSIKGLLRNGTRLENVFFGEPSTAHVDEIDHTTIEAGMVLQGVRTALTQPEGTKSARVLYAERALLLAKQQEAQAKERLSLGSLGFFEEYDGLNYGTDNQEWEGENGTTGDVYAYLESIPDGVLYADGTLASRKNIQSYTHFGEETDASSLSNMKQALMLLEKLNTIRAAEGLSAVRVSSKLMLDAQLTANANRMIYKDTKKAGHLHFNPSENLSYGYQDPFSGWYTDEKKLYEKYLAGSYTGADIEHDAGHYLNIIRKTQQDGGTSGKLLLSGFGHTSGAGLEKVDVNNFFPLSRYSSHTANDFDTVETYRKAFNAYCIRVERAAEEAEKAVLVAEENLNLAIHQIPETLQPNGINLNKTAFTYDGTVKQPTITVSDTSGRTLIQNTDYTLSFSSGCILPGTYTVMIEGIGDYNGTVERSFSIEKAKMQESWVFLSSDAFVYDGSLKRPSISVKNSTGMKLVEGEDYQVVYPDQSVKPGSYTLLVKGSGVYTGTVEKRYFIQETLNEGRVSLDVLSFTYDGSVKKPIPTV